MLRNGNELPFFFFFKLKMYMARKIYLIKIQF